MNILIIGNGFDLAHGLPTKYTDFLNFCDCVLEIFTNPLDKSFSLNKGTNPHQRSIHPSLKHYLRKAYANRSKNYDRTKIMLWDFNDLNELFECIEDNLWLLYFLQCDMHGKENWIDFEKEISYVVQDFDNFLHNNEFTLYTSLTEIASIDISLYSKFNTIKKIWKSVFKPKNEDNFNYKYLMDWLLEDLNKLTRAFEIYLGIIMKKITIDKVSPDITRLKIEHVLSFNYTHTYDMIYRNKDNSSSETYIKRDAYVHGEADLSNSIESNNMVLGIDEYLENDRRNKETDFIKFKKFYQRLYKECDSNAKDWIAEIKRDAEYAAYGRKILLENSINGQNDNEIYPDIRERAEKMIRAHDSKYEKTHPKHNLYIFGHSLDITDKDILRDLILNDNVNTTIYFYLRNGSKEDLGNKIANLSKVIGQDELIKRTGGKNPSIKFVKQNNMININQNIL